MIWKYRNEMIVLIAFLLLAGGFIYQKSMSTILDTSLRMNKTAARQITETKILQKVWDTNGIDQNVTSIRDYFIPTRVKIFDSKKGKLNAEFDNMNGKELNLLSTKLALLPVNIEKFEVVRSGDKYRVRFECTW